MEPLTALIHVGYCLLVAMVLIAINEGLLYVMLCRFKASWYWPFMGVCASVMAVIFGYLFGSPLNAETHSGTAAFSFVDHWSPSWSAGSFMGVLAIAWFFCRVIKGRWAIPFLMTAPTMMVVTLLVVYPFFFELRLAFANLNLYSIGRWLQGEPLSFAGLQNLINVFTTSPLQTATFWELLFRTILWTGINISFHVGFGLFLAMLLNNPLAGRAIYRTLLIIPWAVPQVVAVLAWRGEFHPQFGMVNQLLRLVGVAPVNWWSDPVPIFVSCCIVNIWLGIPFMMIVFLGGLQSIPKSLYEAAQIDGASKFRQFIDITLPMLRPVVVPSVTLGTIWTFNNINVIYLMTGQDGGNESADILVSALYKSAFTYSRYSFAAAFALIIFAVLMAVTVMWMKVSGGAESATAR